MKRDFAALEQRRLRAAKLLDQGWTEADVAREVGVHRQSVNRWKKALEAEGRAALKHPGRAGRRRKLTAAELNRIERQLKRGPRKHGYKTDLWTTKRVADLIERETGVRYHPGHVWKILRDLGWSCQRPTGRARERDEKAIQQWKKVRWPAVKKTPE
jgi:transposase